MKKMGRMILAALMVMVLGTTMIGCGKKETSSDTNAVSESDGQNITASEEVYTLKIGNTVSDIDPTNLGYQYFKEMLEEKTNGRIQVSIFSNGSIAATDRDVLEQVQDGTLQMGNTMPGLFAGLSGIDDYYIWNLPYIYKSEEDMYKLAESDWALELNEQFLDKTGVRIIADGSYNMGWYAFGSTKTQLDSLAAMKGMKMRINEIPQLIELASLIEMTPTFISFGEVYTACQQGLVDGMMTAQNLFWANGYNEVLSSILVVKNGAAFHQYIVNDEWYQSLPEDLKTIFDECVADMTTYVRDQEKTFTEECMNNLTENGCTVYYVSEEENDYIESVVQEKIWPNKDVALCDYSVVQKAQEILAQ
jgi:TRAP-type C4-dicarboxylate transport system substrate-binding protein